MQIADGRAGDPVFDLERTVIEKEPSLMDDVSAKAIVTGDDLVILVFKDGDSGPAPHAEPTPHLAGVRTFTI